MFKDEAITQLLNSIVQTQFWHLSVNAAFGPLRIKRRHSQDQTIKLKVINLLSWFVFYSSP